MLGPHYVALKHFSGYVQTPEAAELAAKSGRHALRPSILKVPIFIPVFVSEIQNSPKHASSGSKNPKFRTALDSRASAALNLAIH